MSQLGGGAGALCPRFSQNAWKKDLCSNCFKSKEEHTQEAKNSRSRYLSSLYAIRTPMKPEKPPQGILKSILGSKKSSLKVNFPPEESKVIGYGGEEFSDDEDVFDFEPDKTTNEDEVQTDSADDDKDFQRLTKSNTDFNSISSNLAENAEVKKPQMPLMLGQLKTEKDGQKPAVLVSIKPFGSSAETNISASRKSHLSKLLDEGSKEVDLKTQETAQEIVNSKSADKLKVVDKDAINNDKISLDETKKADSLKSESSPEKTSKENTLISKTVVDSTTLKTDNNSDSKNEVLKSITNNVLLPATDIIERQTETGKDETGVVDTNIAADKSLDSIVRKPSNDEDKTSLKISSLDTTSITGCNEVRKTQITRGSVLTKNHEQVKTKRFQSSGVMLKLDDLSNQNDKNVNDQEEESMKENCSDLQNVQQNVGVKFDANNALNVSNVTVQQKNFKNIAEDATRVNGVKAAKESAGFNYISAIATLKNELKLKQIEGLTRPSSIVETDKIKTETRGCGVGGKEEGLSNLSFVNGIGSTFKDIIGKERVIDDDKEVTLQVMKILDSEGLSREMAGEPDGRADSDDLNEPPPALPLTPPPNADPHPRPSFLHSLSKEKPKIPAKPKVPDSLPALLIKEMPCEQGKFASSVDANFLPIMDPSKGMKRQAPKPPPVSPCETPTGLFQRNSAISTNPDSPVIKEREKRERANSCSPLPTPEPSPRRSLSLSHDSLAGHIVVDKQYSPPEKICTKRGNKVRSTLRKILRFGSRDEECLRVEDEQPPALRPRPEIIHPLDLNKSAVQVLRSDGTTVILAPKNEGVSPDTPSSPPRSQGFILTGRPSKPPPPPRSQSLDMGTRGPLPVRPPPPKAADLAKASVLAQMSADSITQVTCLDGVYANLGEARMEVMPEKPQRSGSIRDSTRSSSTKSDDVTSESKEKQNNMQGENSSGDSENVYESIVPECDLPQAGERSLSLTIPYCGSETESDIYYPYTFSSSEEGPEDDADADGWRLGGSRRGRSVVHASLEENYGAVIVANHDALTQLLEQASNRCPSVPSPLRTLRNASNLHWSDFKLEDNVKPVFMGSRSFHGAQWGDTPVTLCVNGCQARVPPTMCAIAEFNDLVPQHFVRGGTATSAGDSVRALVSVLLRQTVDRLQRHKWPVQATGHSGLEVAKEAALVTVQLVNGLKALQARGVEEADLAEFVLCRDDKHNSLRICLLPNDAPDSKTKVGSKVSLCQCMIGALSCLPLPPALSNLLASLLREERATSLSQAKAVLEFWLWGPGDVPLKGDRQISLQRWLDLERATVLQSLVVSFPPPPKFNSADHCHLSFLVHTSAKVMADASSLFELHRNETSGV